VRSLDVSPIRQSPKSKISHSVGKKEFVLQRSLDKLVDRALNDQTSNEELSRLGNELFALAKENRVFAAQILENQLSENKISRFGNGAALRSALLSLCDLLGETETARRLARAELEALKLPQRDPKAVFSSDDERRRYFQTDYVHNLALIALELSLKHENSETESIEILVRLIKKTNDPFFQLAEGRVALKIRPELKDRFFARLVDEKIITDEQAKKILSEGWLGEMT